MVGYNKNYIIDLKNHRKNNKINSYLISCAFYYIKEKLNKIFQYLPNSMKIIINRI